MKKLLKEISEWIQTIKDSKPEPEIERWQDQFVPTKEKRKIQK